MLISMKKFKDRQKMGSDVDTLKNMMVALKDAYRYLHPYAKYPLFYSIVKEILLARIEVRENIKRIQAKEKEHEEIYSK